MNPGPLAKGKTGGSFAVVMVQPKEGESLADRTRVELRCI